MKTESRDDKLIRCYHTFKRFLPKELKKFEDYKNNLEIVRDYIVITDNEKNNEPLKLIFSDSNDLNDIAKIPCVYILMFDDEARYVGQTNNLHRRVNYSHPYKIFNNILYIKCFDKKMRLAIEKEILLSVCYPLYNHYRQTG